MIIMKHPADLLLVDAHAEGRGGDHDIQLSLHELLLNLVALRRREAAVIRTRCDVAVTQQACELGRSASRRDIHNACATTFCVAHKLMNDAECQKIALLAPSN